MVTGVYYERDIAERAVAALRSKGVPPDGIFLESEVTAGPEAGWKGGEITRIEQERRLAGRETGLLMGITFGVISGLGISVLGGVLHEWMVRMPGNEPMTMPYVLASPWLAAVAAGLIGAVVGWVIGFVVDATLTRLGAGPPLPAHETLVTVQTDDEHMDQVRGTLFHHGARHLHLAERPAA
jgi:hypothetical protein